METTHEFFFQDSRRLDPIPSSSVDLVVTSPPYPMIEMWDTLFSRQNSDIETALKKQDGNNAFELMHKILDSVWDEVFRVLKTGGFACINIGDATRTLKSDFAVYSNHSRILQHLVQIGFTVLPEIIWRKQTNAPNKFMGSGMLPAGAYVTLEHEYVLIVRKGSKREFKKETEKQNRRESAIFWEERNMFFSDIWFDIKGARQGLVDKTLRNRSAAFPFELAFRLINMYSVKTDAVLDPFLGTGTTMAAAMAAGRNSVGFEIDANFNESIMTIKDRILDFSNHCIKDRLHSHLAFIADRTASGKPIKHQNVHYGFPVITSQEKELILNELIKIESMSDSALKVIYSDLPQLEFHHPMEKPVPKNNPLKGDKNKQLELF